MRNYGIECGHYLTLDGKGVGWVLRSGTVQTGLRKTIWIETVDDYDLVYDYIKLYTDEQDSVEPRKTTILLAEDFDDRVRLQ